MNFPRTFVLTVRIGLIIALLGFACCKKCVQGHWIHRHRDQYTRIEITNAYGQFYRGGAAFPHAVIEPARDWDEYICDEYQKK